MVGSLASLARTSWCCLALLVSCAAAPAPVVDAGLADAGLADAGPQLTFVPLPSTPSVASAMVTVAGRQVTVFAPAAGIPADSFVLVLNDGQDVVALGLTGTLDLLWTRGVLQPMVVLAVPAGDRLQEYGTAENGVAIPCLPDVGQPLLGTKAADYATFVTRDLLSFARSTLGVGADARRTGLLGASLGGLSAFSIAWDNPQAFGFAGAMSGSFWWRTEVATVEQRQASRIMPAIVSRSTARPGLRLWLEAGTADETSDRDMNGVIDAIQDTTDLIAAVGTKAASVTYVEVPNGRHEYPTWHLVLQDFLTWAAPK